MPRQTASGLIENSHLLAVAGGASLLAVIVLAGLAAASIPSAPPAGRVLPTAVERGDTDGDGVRNSQDPFPNTAKEWADTDGDKIGNNSDSNSDGDPFLNKHDPFPFGVCPTGVRAGVGCVVDFDNDGTPDKSDPDKDGDGILNGREKNSVYVFDADNDGRRDDIEGTLNPDTYDPDKDGIPSYREMIERAKELAARVGVALPAAVSDFTVFPASFWAEGAQEHRALFAAIPISGNDHDNDGQHDAIDSFDYTPTVLAGGGGYLDRFARHAGDLAKEAAKYGFAPFFTPEAARAFFVNQSPAAHDMPERWRGVGDLLGVVPGVTSHITPGFRTSHAEQAFEDYVAKYGRLPTGGEPARDVVYRDHGGDTAPPAGTPTEYHGQIPPGYTPPPPGAAPPPGYVAPPPLGNESGTPGAPPPTYQPPPDYSYQPPPESAPPPAPSDSEIPH